MEPQEETGGLKRTHESSSDDDDYGTPTDSPRDDSLGYYNITYIANRVTTTTAANTDYTELTD